MEQTKAKEPEFLKFYEKTYRNGNHTWSPQEKLLIIFNTVKEGIKNKEVWNVDFTELKERASSLKGNSISYNMDYAYSPREYEILRRKLLKQYPANQLKDFFEKHDSLLELHNTITEAKQYIKKGRKPNPNAKKVEIYTPPPSATKDILKLNAVLEEYTTSIKTHLIKMNSKNITDSLNRFMKNKKKTDSLYSYFHPKGSMTSIPNYDFIRQLINEECNYGKGVYTHTKVHAHIKKIKDMAIYEADRAIDQFKAKNIAKLTSIVGKKGSLKNSRMEKIYTSSGVITGDMFFEFKDGSKFKVVNQVVLVINSHGTWFYRFPTTFHDITTSKGKFHKMKKEKWMNEEFVK